MLGKVLALRAVWRDFDHDAWYTGGDEGCDLRGVVDLEADAEVTLLGAQEGEQPVGRITAIQDEQIVRPQMVELGSHHAALVQGVGGEIGVQDQGGAGFAQGGGTGEAVNAGIGVVATEAFAAVAHRVGMSGWQIQRRAIAGNHPETMPDRGGGEIFQDGLVEFDERLPAQLLARHAEGIVIGATSGGEREMGEKLIELDL